MMHRLNDVQPLEWDEVQSPGRDEWHGIVTVTIGELLDNHIIEGIILGTWGAFDAYSEEQRERLWAKFVGRFKYREIGILPVRRWLDRLLAKLNEIMPKYKLLYKAIDDGASVLTIGDEYHKGRDVHSTFPQTALGGSNQDYASSGNDKEYETIRDMGLLEVAEKIKAYNDVDVLILEELESLFLCVHTLTLATM
jgi:hypothetical protein